MLICDSPSTRTHAEQFVEVMKRYQQSIKDPELRNLDVLSRAHSWDDVMRIAKDAELVYLEAGKTGARRAGRFVATHAESVVPFLSLIPNGFYTSIVCGGLKLIFEVRISSRSGCCDD
jgi:hypothetical protein